jgi:hypothetical protein
MAYKHTQGHYALLSEPWPKPKDGTEGQDKGNQVMKQTPQVSSMSQCLHFLS